MVFWKTTRRNSVNDAFISSRRALSHWTVQSDTGIVSYQGIPRYQTVIGLEIHAQLDISTKLFSGCPTEGGFGTGLGLSSQTTPNTMVWPLDVAVPGFLPRLSQEAVQAAVLSAAALRCHLTPVSRFERKHYFYADLPLGYQITQQRWPLARNGQLKCQRSSKHSRVKNNKKQKSSNNHNFTIGIDRIQMEQDTGKTLLLSHPITRQKQAMVDFNRAGRALIEIVLAPDLRSAVDASTAVETLRLLLKHIGTCDGKMEDGSLRCDLNVSIAPIVDDKDEVDDDKDEENTIQKQLLLLQRTGKRVEVKNLNSLRQIQQSAEYEAIRQAEAVEYGVPTAQETRTFDVRSGQTVTIRTKESAKDYRFMPEPDLPPLVLNESVFDGQTLEEFIETHLPELPEDARQRLQKEYGLSDTMAAVIVSDPPAIDLFDTAIEQARFELQALGMDVDEKQLKEISQNVANLLCNELFALVREHEMQRLIEEGNMGTISVRYSKVTGMQLGSVVVLIMEGQISITMAKHLMRILYEEKETLQDASPRQVARDWGYQLITDSTTIGQICRNVVAEHPEEIERYKLGGKYARKITKFLIGKAMATSKGNAHPERLNEIMVEVLEEIAPLDES